MEPQLLWVSTSGANEAQFLRDTSDCLSRTAAAGGSGFVPCMNGKGWEEQASVGAAQPAVVEH